MEFDYLIIGAGKAGSVLAARLGEDPDVSVCLIEAGSVAVAASQSAGFEAVGGLLAGLAKLQSGPAVGRPTLLSEPQAALNARRLALPCAAPPTGPRPYLRGHPEDFNRWAALGAEGWDWPGCLPGYLRAENNSRGASGLHSAEGPLQVSDPLSPAAASLAFVKAAVRLGIEESNDFNARPFSGAGLYQQLLHHSGGQVGKPSGPAAYQRLARLQRNVTLLCRSTVETLEIEGNRVVGLRYRSLTGRKLLRARREVLLTAGGLGSPLLLMLSGVGPAEMLATAGIALRHPLPGLGQRIKAQPAYALDWRIGRNAPNLPNAPGYEAAAIVHSNAKESKAPQVSRPDLRLEINPGARRFRARATLLHPASEGRLWLGNLAKSAPPALSVDPNCLSQSRDRHTLQEGAERLEEILAQPELRDWRPEEARPSVINPARLESHIEFASPVTGACRIGQDNMSVIDPSLRLHGLDGIRIIDASSLPETISGEVDLAVIMLAERAAELIRHAP